MQRNRMLATKARTVSSVSKTITRSLATKAPVVPRILDRRENETGPGGRGSDAGLKVAVFGASGMLGRYVCSHLGELYVLTWESKFDTIFLQILISHGTLFCFALLCSALLSYEFKEPMDS